MIRLALAALAVVAAVVPLTATTAPAVAGAALLGLLLAAVGVGTLWRWPFTAASCVLLAGYAGGLWLARAPLRVFPAAGLGLALLLLLACAELARSTRRTTIDARVVRAQLLGWAGFAVGTGATVMLAMALAGGLAGSIPLAVAPFIVAAAAVGAVLTLAAAISSAPRSSGRSHEAQ